MSSKHLIISLVFISIGQFLIAQQQFNDTIFFMNGDILPCTIQDDSDIDVEFEFKKRKRIKSKGVHKSEIFGISKKGEKQIYYAQNEIVGDDLSLAEVELYLAGQRDARSNYKTRLVFYSGLAISTAASALGEAGLLAVTVPTVTYPIAQYIPVIKIKENTITNINHKYNILYSEGYEGVARGKRVMAGLKGSALGSVIGAILYRAVLK